MPTNLNTKNIAAGKPAIVGSVYVGSTTQTLPTSATTTIASGFASLGYISEDGVTNSNSPETDSKKAWGGDTVLTYQTAKEDTFSFTMIEALREAVLKTVYGSSNVETSTAGEIKVKANAAQAEEKAYIMDIIMGEKLKRIVVPKATVTEIGEVTYKDDEAVGYETTITAVPDSSGNTHYEYITEKQGTTEGQGTGENE